jgi:hypothetical protein
VQEAPQTVAHVLMDCPGFDALREETWEGRENIPRDLKEFLADQRQVRRSAIFMVETPMVLVSEKRGTLSADSRQSAAPAASEEESIL